MLVCNVWLCPCCFVTSVNVGLAIKHEANTRVPEMTPCNEANTSIETLVATVRFLGNGVIHCDPLNPWQFDPNISNMLHCERWFQPTPLQKIQYESVATQWHSQSYPYPICSMMFHGAGIWIPTQLGHRFLGFLEIHIPDNPAPCFASG